MRPAHRFAVRATATVTLVVLASLWVSVAPIRSATTSPATIPDVARLSGAIRGSGSTLAARYYKAVLVGFSKTARDVTVEYRAIGSGRGKSEFGKGLTDFAGTESAVKDTDGIGVGTFVYVPTTAAAITIAYNLKGVKDLKLSPATLAKIFQRDIQRWDDPAIASENPDVRLPDKAIALVRRADRSGTTSNFTKYLTLAAPTVWRLGTGDTIKWPAASGRGEGNYGVAKIVANNNGAVGYVDLADAKALGLSVAAIKNKGGEYVRPTSAGITAALSEVTFSDDLTFQPLNSDGAESYPITTATYLLARTNYENQQTADLVVGFLTYVLTKGQDVAERTSYARLPEPLRLKALSQLDKITVGP